MPRPTQNRKGGRNNGVAIPNTRMPQCMAGVSSVPLFSTVNLRGLKPRRPGMEEETGKPKNERTWKHRKTKNNRILHTAVSPPSTLGGGHRARKWKISCISWTAADGGGDTLEAWRSTLATSQQQSANSPQYSVIDNAKCKIFFTPMELRW